MRFEERTYNFHDAFIQEMYAGAETMVAGKIAEYDRTH